MASFVNVCTSCPTADLIDFFTALRIILKTRKKRKKKKTRRAVDMMAAVGQSVCQNVIRMLVSLGADPVSSLCAGNMEAIAPEYVPPHVISPRPPTSSQDQRDLYIGHDGKPDDLVQCRQIASIVQQVLDDQRSHAALLSGSSPPPSPQQQLLAGAGWRSIQRHQSV